MENPLIPSSNIEHRYIVRAPYHRSQELQRSFSAEERHRKAMFETGNTKFGPDGRTYVSIGEDGEYQSCFVSQFSPIIDRNIEPKVKNVCLELHKKNYLTFGSCQGHSDSKVRWIGLAFNTLEQKKEFIENVNRLELEIHWYDNHINSTERPSKKEPWYSDGLRLHIVWDRPFLENESITEKRNFPYSDKDLTKFWNLQMCRNYDHYESVIMVIGRKIIYNNWFDQLKTYVKYDEGKIDQITKQLEEKINLIPLYYG